MPMPCLSYEKNLPRTKRCQTASVWFLSWHSMQSDCPSKWEKKGGQGGKYFLMIKAMMDTAQRLMLEITL